jgi:outer membrane protein TolC
MAKRIDLINQNTILKNCELDYKVAANGQLPSLRLNMNAGSIDYSPKTYGQSMNDVNKQWSVGLEMNYPLGNSEADGKITDAKINYQKNLVELKRLEKQIRDEVDSDVKQCGVLYGIYQQTKKSAEYSREYYGRIYAKFKRGRSSAIQMKLALESFIQMRQAEMNSLVNYNVALLRRDLTRNVIFENLGIKVDDILKREASK